MTGSRFLYSDKPPLLSGLWTGVVIGGVGKIFSEGLLSITDKLLRTAKGFCHS
jgi:hypothetical protein